MADYTYALSSDDLLPVKGNTSWGYYDDDPSFISDAQKACFYVAKRLGYGVVDVELVDFQIYTAYEEAVTTYGNEVYLYKIRENYLSLEGTPTDSFLDTYDISYFNASLSFSPPEQATLSDFQNDESMSWLLDSGSIWYKVSASILPSMSRADFSQVQSFNLEGQSDNFLPQYTYMKGDVVNFIVKDPTDFLNPDDVGFFDVSFIDNNYFISGNPSYITHHVIQYIKYKSDYNMNTRITEKSLGGVVRIANKYADQAFLKDIPTYSASLDLQYKVQEYDIKAALEASGELDPNDNPVVTRVFYEEFPAMAMFNYPFPGLGGVPAFGADGFGGTFNGFGGANFMMWPVFYNIQRIQGIDMTRNVIGSGYTFSINDNKIKVFPIPQGGRLWFEWAKESDVLAKEYNLNSNAEPHDTPVVTDIMNVPYAMPTYSRINSVGKSWVMRYTLAICKEILGFARGKYPSVDLPKVGAMGYSDLLSQSQADKQALLEQLRDLLDMTSKQKQLERQRAENEAAKEMLKDIPLPNQIYIM